MDLNSFSLAHISIVSWLKLSKALCRLACIPVGGSFVILIADSRIPCNHKKQYRILQQLVRQCASNFVIQRYVQYKIVIPELSYRDMSKFNFNFSLGPTLESLRKTASWDFPL